MTTDTARPGEDGRFYVHAHADRPIAGPFARAGDAARHAEALTRDRWLLVVVEKSERSASPWDAYVKFFRHVGDGRCAEEQLLDWWLALPDRSYTRTRAGVRVFDITDREWNLLAPGSPRGALDPLAREPADPALAVSLAPDAIRAHFRATDQDQRARALPDWALSWAARDTLSTSDRLRASLDGLCLDVLQRAVFAAADADGGR
jgi:hypothetical protein